MENYKTTLLGIASILIAIGTFLKAAFDGDPSTVPDYEATFMAVTLGVGLISAKDSTK